MEPPDYLPISMLNQYLYCPRRFWYMYVQGEMDINTYVLEGTYQHERAHAHGRESDEGTQTLRRVYVFSDRLGLAGFVDLIEIEDGQMAPVEYKHGKMGKWVNDEVQLCAQALCLEERTGRSLSAGEIFYFGSRRRQHVALDEVLRARTEETVRHIAALLAGGQMPLPTDQRAKCRDCSLEPICLPNEVERLAKEMST
jgi:CRISPR-associated exonuclease Cas4